MKVPSSVMPAFVLSAGSASAPDSVVPSQAYSRTAYFSVPTSHFRNSLTLGRASYLKHGEPDSIGSAAQRRRQNFVSI